jgi:predicted tellurium resistance membrane protein TerC
MFEWIMQPEAWVALLTLTALEIVLGIDNIIFISILVGRLPAEQRVFARRAGLGLALITRLGLLMSLAWIMGLTDPLFTLLNQAISGRDIILIGGGLFLLAKSTHEIHNSLEGEEENEGNVAAKAGSALLSILMQIAVLDIVFSLDSVITAVGMVSNVTLMAMAIIIAVVIMLWASGPISDFVEAHPSIKMLALSFLILVGVTLIAEGLNLHVPKGYIYFAMAFSFGVEMININMRKKRSKAIALRKQISE